MPVPEDNSEPCTASYHVIYSSGFNASLSNEQACDLHVTYLLTGLNSRQKTPGGVHPDGNKASFLCFFSLDYFEVYYMCACESVWMDM